MQDEGGNPLRMGGGDLLKNLLKGRIFAPDLVVGLFRQDQDLAIGQGLDASRAFFAEDQGEIAEIVAILQDAEMLSAILG